MDQKAKKIKDQTVRSLESEVQKIMNRWDGLSYTFFIKKASNNLICADMPLS